MIFGSRRQRNDASSTEATDDSDDQLDATASAESADTDRDGTDPDGTDRDGAGPEQDGRDQNDQERTIGNGITLAELDAQDWRDLGPYDLTEVDADALEEGDPDQPRIDLGSVVLAATDGMELRLQVDENSQQIVSAMMLREDSALEVGAFAAPRSGGLWAEIRDELVEAAEQAGGSANLVPGPFGVELRRLLPVRTPDGEEGYQPSRMWVAEGPRWMLRGVIYGQAALEDGIASPVAEILEAFRQIVVRRGDEAMAPGDLLPLSLPENADVGPDGSALADD